MPLLVLRLLRESSQSEWEILSRLHLRYGFTPSAREFARLEKALINSGYATIEQAIGGGSRLRITAKGIGVLVRLENEYRGVVSNIVRSQATGAAG